MNTRINMRNGCGEGQPSGRAAAGFTLLELMAAVAVVSILAIVALPSFKNALVKNHRASVETFLSAVAQQEQQYFIDNRSYAACGSVSACASALSISAPSDASAYYTVAVTLSTSGPPGFIVTATPNSGTIQASDATLTLANTGVRTPAGLW